MERVLYRMFRVDPDSEQRWTVYAASLLAFSFFGIVLLYLLQPFDFARAAVEPSVAFNTAISFDANTKSTLGLAKDSPRTCSRPCSSVEPRSPSGKASTPAASHRTR